jgi:hypothetical protein
MMVAAEKQNNATGVALDIVLCSDVFGDQRSQAPLMTMSRARMRANKVRSIVRPANSALESDFAWRVALSTSTALGSGGSSKGPGLMDLRWLEGALGVAVGWERALEGTLLRRLNEQAAETSAARNRAKRRATIT